MTAVANLSKNLVKLVEELHMNKDVQNLPAFRPGDLVTVHVKIQEGNKSRIQLYQGTCIAIRRRNSINGSFTVRKSVSGNGVERVFPFHSPAVTKVEVDNHGKSRRAKHYYLREREGKSARVAVDYDRN